MSQLPSESPRLLNAGVVAAHELAMSAYFVLALIVTGYVVWDCFKTSRVDGELAIGFVFLPFMALHWWVARGAKRGKRWVRGVSFFLGAALCVLTFPILTVFGVCIFYHLQRGEWQTGQ
jgi:hypothetical protein